MTGILGAVVIYIYAMIGYYETTLHSTMNANTDFGPVACTDAFNCFLWFANIGLRTGGGVGETLL